MFQEAWDLDLIFVIQDLYDFRQSSKLSTIKRGLVGVSAPWSSVSVGICLSLLYKDKESNKDLKAP